MIIVSKRQSAKVESIVGDLTELEKVIYIDGKPTALKVDKLWRSADAQNISSYQAQIIVPAPKIFSKLMKVEFKKK